MSVSRGFLTTVQKTLTFKERKYLEFYPDTIPYTYTKDEYRNVCNELITNLDKKPYLYVRGYQIKPVSSGRRWWERFCTKLGLEDHCNDDRVKMTLLKLMYYGYANGFDNSRMVRLLVAKYPDMKQIGSIFNEPYSAEKLAQLQKSLINYYADHVKAMRASVWKRIFSSRRDFIPKPEEGTFVFGDSMIALAEKTSTGVNEIVRLIAHLKPQEQQFLSKHVEFIVSAIPAKEMPSVIPVNSPMAKSIARQYMILAQEVKAIHKEKAKKSQKKGVLAHLKELLGFSSEQQSCPIDWNRWGDYANVARELNPQLEQTFFKEFIYYSFYKELYAEAARLVFQIRDINIQYELIISDKEYEQNILPFVKKDTPLAHMLAKRYLAQAQQQNNHNIFVLVDRLASWPLAPEQFFKYYIEIEKYDAAYGIFSTNVNGGAFKEKYRSRLAEHFSEVAVKSRDEGKHNLGGNWQWACRRYRDSLREMKKSYKLSPGNKQYSQGVNIFRNQYAQTIFKAITVTGTNYEQWLDKILIKYGKCFEQGAAKYDKTLIDNYIEALEKRAELSMSRCLDPTSTCDGVEATLTHKQRCWSDILESEKYLKQGIEILGKKGDELKRAKFHFMLGDLQRIFSLGGCQENLKMAKELQPNNPFYAACYAEQIDDKKKLAKAWELFPKNGLLHPPIYYDWKEERWHRDKIKSKDLADIHSYNVKKPGLFG